ncbi:MAG TPA: hypothetical protein PK059_13805, partial [Cyclobacteriaceae bacterium]|nr:hypothetical protein [Cyclobacteriaceae bacterium]
NHALAVKSDGSLWAWGSNTKGQLGDDTTTNHNAPVKVGDGYADVAAGESHSLGLKKDGTLWAWGYNGSGQVGDGTTVDKHIPVNIAN